MDARTLMDVFVGKCPFAVLTQLAIRGLVQDDLDQVFRDNAQRQYQKNVLFSDLAIAVSDVVLQLSGNFNQAYEQHKKTLGVSKACFYDKINHIETNISEALVRRIAERAAHMQDQLDYVPWDVLPGFTVFSVDGNHLTEADKRLAPLRDIQDAPLAGTIVARFDHQRQLFDRAYLLEDAHDQESSTQGRIAEDLDAGDVLVADRHHCVLGFLRDIDQRGAFFVIRQHGRFKGVLVGKRKKVGRTDRGVVYEQKIRTSDSPDAQVMRRITIELSSPTQKGESEVHLLTNLPSEVSAESVSQLYLVRWEVETGFYYLTTSMTCELKSVSHPKAALFLFCSAMLAFNVRQVLLAALYAEHPDESVLQVSHFQVSLEVSKYTDGMLAVMSEEIWSELLPSSPSELCMELRRISRGVDLSSYKKSVRGPKNKKPAKPKRDRPKTHASVAKLLKAAKSKTP